MKKIRDALSESLIEIILSVIFLVVGYGIMRLLGGEGSLSHSDPDTLMLIGIVAFALVGGLIFLAVRVIKRLKRRDDAEKEDAECNLVENDDN